MKKALVFLSICFLQAGMVFSQSVTTLDDAIKNAGSVLGFRIPANTNVMVLHFQSPTADLSDYIVKRLTVALKGDNFLKIVEERNRPSLQKYNLKNTEDLNDSRAKTIGGELGMGMVLAGFVQSSGPSSSTWNFQVRAVSPRDGKVFFSQNYKLREDKTLAALIEVKTPPADPAPAAPVAVPQPAPAPAAPVLPAPVVTPPPAAPVIPKPAPAVTSSKPANGTYTFYPRPQGYQGAAKVNAYLNKIVVRGDYMSIYLTKAAQGPGSAGAPFGNWFVIYVPMNKIVLQDLDNPSKSYTAEQYDYSGEDGPYFTYKGVPARRFSLTNTYEKVPIVFEEIILGDPD